MRLLFLGLMIILAPLACKEDDVSGDANPSVNKAETVDEKLVQSVLMGRSNLDEAEVREYFQKCFDEGGKGFIGGFGQMACEKETVDGGQACTQNSDCSGFCLAETKTCTKKEPQFGCFPVLPSPGQKATICVD